MSPGRKRLMKASDTRAYPRARLQTSAKCLGFLLTGKHLHQYRRDGQRGSCRRGAEFAKETLSVDRPNLIECHLAPSVLKGDSDTGRIGPFRGGHRGNDDGAQIIVGLVR